MSKSSDQRTVQYMAFACIKVTGSFNEKTFPLQKVVWHYKFFLFHKKKLKSENNLSSFLLFCTDQTGLFIMNCSF